MKFLEINPQKVNSIPPLFRENLKTSFSTSKEDMTLIIATNCKDGIVIQSDTRFTRGDDYSVKEGKLFNVVKSKNLNIELVLSGQKD